MCIIAIIMAIIILKNPRVNTFNYETQQKLYAMPIKIDRDTLVSIFPSSTLTLPINLSISSNINPSLFLESGLP